MNKNTTITIVASVIIIFGFLALVYQSSIQKDQKAAVPIEGVSKTQADDHVKWASEGATLLVEYSDFQCPACGSFFPVIKSLGADPEIADNVQFTYRHYPLQQIHKNAEPAALAAEAAGAQGSFYEYHDLLFENQSQWSEVGDPQELFEQYAQELELDIEQFRTYAKSDEAKAKVDNDKLSGNQAGVSGTPTLFLNGVKMNYSTIDDFTSQVKAAIAK